MFRWFRIATRLTELENEMLKLTRVVGDRDLDWTEMRARCKRLLDRTEKAARFVERKEAEVESEEPQTAAEGEVSARVDGHFLTPHQRQVQQIILRRRAGLE